MSKESLIAALQRAVNLKSSSAVFNEPRTPINGAAVTELVCSSGEKDPPPVNANAKYWAPTPPPSFIGASSLTKKPGLDYYTSPDRDFGDIRFVGWIPRIKEKEQFVVQCMRCKRYGRVTRKFFRSHKACPFCEAEVPKQYVPTVTTQKELALWGQVCPHISLAKTKDDGVRPRIGFLTLVGYNGSSPSNLQFVVKCDCGAYGLTRTWRGTPTTSKRSCPYCKAFRIRFRQKATVCDLPDWWPINKEVLPRLLTPEMLRDA